MENRLWVVCEWKHANRVSHGILKILRDSARLQLLLMLTTGCSHACTDLPKGTAIAILLTLVKARGPRCCLLQPHAYACVCVCALWRTLQLVHTPQPVTATFDAQLTEVQTSTRTHNATLFCTGPCTHKRHSAQTAEIKLAKVIRNLVTSRLQT